MKVLLISFMSVLLFSAMGLAQSATAKVRHTFQFEAGAKEYGDYDCKFKLKSKLNRPLLVEEGHVYTLDNKIERSSESLSDHGFHPPRWSVFMATVIGDPYVEKISCNGGLYYAPKSFGESPKALHGKQPPPNFHEFQNAAASWLDVHSPEDNPIIEGSENDPPNMD